ncbi:uncharacterized protein V1516DRAFT_663538 [Lipomyces oligophaga]|uniref:uncharacterized protein n=1 Tax=Lipomyces oligophaga TaxID=45792 RepID=UPI0034CECFC6
MGTLSRIAAFFGKKGSFKDSIISQVDTDSCDTVLRKSELGEELVEFDVIRPSSLRRLLSKRRSQRRKLTDSSLGLSSDQYDLEAPTIEFVVPEQSQNKSSQELLTAQSETPELLGKSGFWHSNRRRRLKKKSKELDTSKSANLDSSNMTNHSRSRSRSRSRSWFSSFRRKPRSPKPGEESTNSQDRILLSGCISLFGSFRGTSCEHLGHQPQDSSDELKNRTGVTLSGLDISKTESDYYDDDSAFTFQTYSGDSAMGDHLYETFTNTYQGANIPYFSTGASYFDYSDISDYSGYSDCYNSRSFRSGYPHRGSELYTIPEASCDEERNSELVVTRQVLWADEPADMSISSTVASIRPRDSEYDADIDDTIIDTHQSHSADSSIDSIKGEPFFENSRENSNENISAIPVDLIVEKLDDQIKEKVQKQSLRAYCNCLDNASKTGARTAMGELMRMYIEDCALEKQRLEILSEKSVHSCIKTEDTITKLSEKLEVSPTDTIDESTLLNLPPSKLNPQQLVKYRKSLRRIKEQVLQANKNENSQNQFEGTKIQANTKSLFIHPSHSVYIYNPPFHSAVTTGQVLGNPEKHLHRYSACRVTQEGINAVLKLFSVELERLIHTDMQDPSLIIIHGSLADREVRGCDLCVTQYNYLINFYRRFRFLMVETEKGSGEGHDRVPVRMQDVLAKLAWWSTRQETIQATERLLLCKL